MAKKIFIHLSGTTFCIPPDLNNCLSNRSRNCTDDDDDDDDVAGLGGSVGCAVRLETRRSRVQPRRGRQHSFVEIDHEIFSTVILSLPLIQEGQLSVSGERMCTILVNRSED